MVAEALKARPANSVRVRRLLERLPVRHSVAFAAYLLLWLIMVGPKILPDLDSRMLSSNELETSVWFWSLEWWSHPSAWGSNPLFSDVIWAPTGLNLAWATTMPGPSLMLTPLTLLFGPVVSFNVLTLLTPPLTAWTAYLLAHRVTRLFPPSLAAGYFFGFSPVVMREVQSGHPNLSLLFLLPLAAYLIVRRLDGTMSRPRFVVLFSIVLVAEFSIFPEIFATMAVVGFVVGAIAMLVVPPDLRKRVIHTAMLVGLCFLVAAVVVTPYLYTALAYPDALKPRGFRGLAVGARTPNDFLKYFLPGRGFALGPAVRPGMTPSVNFWYFGVPLLGLLLAFWIQFRRWWAARLLGLAFLVSVVLAIGRGPRVGETRIPLPWRLVSDLPLIGRARPGRIIAYAFLFASVSVAIWIAARTPSTARKALRWTLVGLAAVAIFPNLWADIWVHDVRLPALFADGLYRQHLCPGEIVLLSGAGRREQALWQAHTGMYFRSAAWYSGFRPENYEDLRLARKLWAGEFHGLEQAAVRRFMAEHRVTAILVRGLPLATSAELGRLIGAEPRPVGGFLLMRLTDCPG